MSTIDIRMSPTPEALAALAELPQRVEALLVGFAVIARAGEHDSWNDDEDWSGGVVLGGPGGVIDAVTVDRAVRIVVSDMIVGLDLQRGSDAAAVALRVQITVEAESLRVVWRYCAMQQVG